MGKAILLICVAATACFASTAQASDISSSCSSTVGITVVIPPIAAALRAQSAGAVGVWTVLDDKSALMIQIPSEVASDADSSASFYRGKDMIFTARIEDSAFFSLKADATSVFNGLTRESFKLHPNAAAPVQSLPHSVTMTIAGV